MKFHTIIVPSFLAVLLTEGWGQAQASGGGKIPPDPAYVRECGECHVPFPARWLSAESWRAILAGLDRHFGQDASLDEETRRAMEDYLVAGARRRPTLAADGTPLFRITESPSFRHEHGEIPARIRREPAVQSPARCEVCHAGATRGQFSEHDIHLPEGVNP